MKPLLARSNSSPQSFVKRVYRPSPISPYHLIHYHGEGDGVSSGGGFVGGWLGRRGSVPDHRQGASSSQSQDNGGGIDNQSRSPPADSRKSSVAQQDDVGAKQRSGQREEGRRVAGNIAASTNTNAVTTTKSSREVAKELVKIRKHKLAME